MKVIIAGSRTITDYELIKQAVKESGWEDKITEIVSGTARGADRLGEKFSRENNIELKRFPAKWDVYGVAAGHKRNYKMGVYANALIAIIEGASRGTKNMIGVMRELEKPVFVKKI